MPTLEHYLQAWSLSSPQLVVVTSTSDLYRVVWQGEQAMLKLLTHTGQRDEKNSVVALKYFDGHGSVRLLNHDHEALLLEFVDDVDLKSLVQSGEDERATNIISAVLKTLHSSNNGAIPAQLTLLELRFRSLFAAATRHEEDSISSLYTKSAMVAKSLLRSEQDVCVLHGDIHHENIIKSTKRGWLAIDPKGLVGECTYDVANVLCNPVGMVDLVANETRLLRTAEILARNLDLDIRRLLAFTFVHAALSAIWSLEDGQDPTLALRVASILEPHQQL